MLTDLSHKGGYVPRIFTMPGHDPLSGDLNVLITDRGNIRQPWGQNLC